MEPISLGVIITLLGGPPAIAGILYRYGQLNQKVTILEKTVSQNAEALKEHEDKDLNSFDFLKTELQSLKTEVVDRLARIEQRLEHDARH